MIITLKKQYYPTGCKRIDNLLGGGFESQIVNHIYGESGTGKSIITLQCAYKAALKGFTTFYIDTERAFSATRLNQIAQDNFSKVGKLIFVYAPLNFSQQMKIIQKLEKFITKNVKIIILDTISALYSASYGINNPKRNYKLNKQLNHQMAELVRLAENYDLAIIVNNQVRSRIADKDPRKLVPFNRNILDHWCKVQLFLTFSEKMDMKKREAILIKHYNQQNEKSCSFIISNEGCQ
ncbi:MAG: DNA repair and recombination protein RadB [Candidatus Helarchaeota archaeon]|nr:DNA repair and recombination protein RadB [Candidatus Helarchaeota archaeon]